MENGATYNTWLDVHTPRDEGVCVWGGGGGGGGVIFRDLYSSA